jgi:hypothetical protein
MLPIVCVLKSGGWKNRNMHVEYGPDNVRWLRDQVRLHAGYEQSFYCLSDVEVAGVTTLKLQDDLPGWWSKLELFAAFGAAFYLDLDTALVGDIRHMLRPKQYKRLAVLRNLSAKESHRIGSGGMAWETEQLHLYQEFMRNPQKHMAECVTPAKWGDQGFIQHCAKEHGGWDILQDKFPNQICSYKLDLLPQGAAPGPQTRIVCFHGEPRPWQVKHDWLLPPLDGTNKTD